MRPKKQAAAELKNKKRSFLGKNSDKQTGAELKKKNRILGPKIGKKIENKRTFLANKNKLRLSLRTKKDFLGQKSGKN